MRLFYYTILWTIFSISFSLQYPYKRYFWLFIVSQWFILWFIFLLFDYIGVFDFIKDWLKKISEKGNKLFIISSKTLLVIGVIYYILIICFQIFEYNQIPYLYLKEQNKINIIFILINIIVYYYQWFYKKVDE